MALKKRYELLGGTFSFWAEASAFTQGYNHAKGLAWNHPDAAVCKLQNELGDGYFKSIGNGGFVVVKTIILTEAERKEIDHKALLKETKAAERNALEAIQKVKRLQEKLGENVYA